MTRNLTLGLSSLMAAVCLLPQESIAGEVFVVMSADLPVYEEVVAGLREEIASRMETRNVEFRVVDMGGDRSRGVDLVSQADRRQSYELIVAVGKWALDAALESEIELPVVYAMVMNPQTVTVATERPCRR